MKAFGIEFGLTRGSEEFLVEEEVLSAFDIEQFSQRLERLNNSTPVKGIIDMHYLDNPWRVKVFFDRKVIDKQQISSWLKKENLI